MATELFLKERPRVLLDPDSQAHTDDNSDDNLEHDESYQNAVPEIRHVLIIVHQESNRGLC